MAETVGLDSDGAGLGIDVRAADVQPLAGFGDDDIAIFTGGKGMVVDDGQAVVGRPGDAMEFQFNGDDGGDR